MTRRRRTRPVTRSMRLKNQQLLIPARAESAAGTKQVLFTLRITAKPGTRIKGARKCPHCWFRGVHVKPGETCGH
ncbi:hypothetical protein HN803_08325 [candidate division WWE3 bacterium]|nr:hypothetical protein [candidate division WWE3 bacterium]MBT7350757.1 hypothetical protein [candidate division WWE3 bacterium]